MPNDRHLQKAISRGRPPGRLNRLTACAKRAQLKALSEDKAISEDAADLAQIAAARNEYSVPWTDIELDYLLLLSVRSAMAQTFSPFGPVVLGWP